MSSNINERLKKVREVLCNNNNTLFASILGTSTQYASSIVKEGKNVGDKTLEKILNAFPEINPVWLKMGEGEMLKTSSSSNVIPFNPNYIKVPLIQVKAVAGYLTGFDDANFIEELPTVEVIADRTFHGKYRCFEVSGDSMDDGSRYSIWDGDIVLGREVKKELWQYKLHIEQWHFIINHVDGLLIKKIVNHNVEKGTITCHSLNPLYGKDFELSLNDVRELYNVIKITERNLRF